MGIDQNLIAADAKICAVDKILPKRNSSVPLVIFWEDGCIGRMTPYYLKKYYADDEISFIMKKLETGEIHMCGCMGRQGNDPYCPCEMRRRGLKVSTPSATELQKLEFALNGILNK